MHNKYSNLIILYFKLELSMILVSLLTCKIGSYLFLSKFK